MTDIEVMTANTALRDPESFVFSVRLNYRDRQSLTIVETVSIHDTLEDYSAQDIEQMAQWMQHITSKMPAINGDDGSNRTFTNLILASALLVSHNATTNPFRILVGYFIRCWREQFNTVVAPGLYEESTNIQYNRPVSV